LEEPASKLNAINSYDPLLRSLLLIERSCNNPQSLFSFFDGVVRRDCVERIDVCVTAIMMSLDRDRIESKKAVPTQPRLFHIKIVSVKEEARRQQKANTP
jgi:hypothetical protein